MGVGIPKIRGRVQGIFPIVQKKTKNKKFFALKHFLEGPSKIKLDSLLQELLSLKRIFIEINMTA